MISKLLCWDSYTRLLIYFMSKYIFWQNSKFFASVCCSHIGSFCFRKWKSVSLSYVYVMLITRIELRLCARGFCTHVHQAIHLVGTFTSSHRMSRAIERTLTNFSLGTIVTHLSQFGYPWVDSVPYILLLYNLFMLKSQLSLMINKFF